MNFHSSYSRIPAMQTCNDRLLRKIVRIILEMGVARIRGEQIPVRSWEKLAIRVKIVVLLKSLKLIERAIELNLCNELEMIFVLKRKCNSRRGQVQE